MPHGEIDNLNVPIQVDAAPSRKRRHEDDTTRIPAPDDVLPKSSKVARGPLVNRFYVPPKFYGVVCDVEGTPDSGALPIMPAVGDVPLPAMGGPWYLKFDCVPFDWFEQIFDELELADFDVTDLQEAQQQATQNGLEILVEFLGGAEFDQALAAAPEHIRWRVGVVRKWYSQRCAGGANGEANVPEPSLFEIFATSAQLGGRTGEQLVGMWCVLALKAPQNDEEWDSYDGWWVDLNDPNLVPQAMALLGYESVSMPRQGYLRALNYPFPEAIEIELEQE